MPSIVDRTAQLAALQRYLDQSERVVFFGGAGVSTESGIPDFRSTDGIYHQRYAFPPEQILSRSFFLSNPAEFFRFYRDKLTFAEAKPNAAHLALARLEQQGKLSAIITQNIDGLHQQAGSKRVLELHGSALRCYCMRCKQPYTSEEMLAREAVPRCDCGGILRPDVVLYEEMLNTDTLEQATTALQEADLVIVGGTSLVVYPAAGLLDYTRAPIVLINRSETRLDSRAVLTICAPIGEVFSQLKG